jgi:hypothetical protein
MTRPISNFALAYSILAGPILWFAHFVIVYGIAEFGCRANLNNWLYFAPENMRLAIAGLTGGMLIIVAVGGMMALRQWNRLPRETEREATPQAYTRFLVMMGILLSGLFFLSIIVTAVPAFFLNVCDKAV